MDNKNIPLRNTRQKAQIVACFKESNSEHITADEIEYMLRAKGINTAKSTIYRFLAKLEESGAVKKYIVSQDMPACYQYLECEKKCGEHYHLMCRECGQLEHFENERLQAMFEEIKKSDGFIIDGKKTVFYGVCRECRKTQDL